MLGPTSPLGGKFGISLRRASQLPHIPAGIIEPKGAGRAGVSTHLIRSHRRGFSFVGLVEIGVLRAKVASLRIIAPIRAARGTFPLLLRTKACAWHFASGAQPAQVMLSHLGGNPNHRQSGPVLLPSVVPIR